jgi:hypothetical protein
MGKTFRNIREDGRRENKLVKNILANRGKNPIDKYKKSIYNSISSEDDDLDYEFDEPSDNESNHTKSIQRK